MSDEVVNLCPMQVIQSSVTPIFRLGMGSGSPGQFRKGDGMSSGQVQTDSRCLDVAKEQPAAWIVLEAIYE